MASEAKPTRDRAKQVNFWADEDVHEFLQASGNKTQVLNDAVRLYMETADRPYSSDMESFAHWLAGLPMDQNPDDPLTSERLVSLIKGFIHQDQARQKAGINTKWSQMQRTQRKGED